MRKFFLVWILVLSVPAIVYAAASNPDSFGGLSLSAGVGGSVNESSGQAKFNYANLFAGGADAFNINTSEKFKAGNRADFVSSFQIDYYQPVHKNILMGLASSFFLETEKDIRSRSYKIANQNNRPDFPIDYRINTKIDPKSHFSLAVEPAYQVHKKVLLYTIFSYHIMRADLVSQTSMNKARIFFPSVTTDTSKRKTFNGIGLGGGMRYKFFKNWFLDVSAEWVYFGKKRVTGPSFLSQFDEITLTQSQTVRPSWVNIISKIGYKF